MARYVPGQTVKLEGTNRPFTVVMDMGPKVAITLADEGLRTQVTAVPRDQISPA